MNTNHSNHETSSLNNDQEGTLEIRFSEILKGFRKFWWLCLLLTVLGAGVMFYQSYIRFTPIYKSSVTFTVQTQETGSANMGITSYSFSYNRATANQLSSTFPSIIKSNILQDIICNELGLSSFPCTLSSSSVSGTNMFTVTATGYDPEITYNVLQSVIKNYPSVAEYVIGNTNLFILNQPEIPTTPSNQLDYRTYILKGALFGFAVGAALIVLYAMSRQTIRSRSDVRVKLNQHCIGVLPEVIFKKYHTPINRSILITNSMLGDGYLESFRACRNSIVSSIGSKKVIMVTSTAPNEGKTSFSTNLALSLAMMKKKVVIVDADLRNPNVCNRLGIAAPASDDQKAFHLTKYNANNLSLSVFTFSNSDKSPAWKILDYKHLFRFFEILRNEYDYVIVDTSPLGLTSDPIAIAPVTDGAILVIKEDTIRISRIQSSIDMILSTDTELFGCVINGADTAFDNYGGKYGYRYGSYGRYGYGYHYGNDYGKEKRHPLRRKNTAEDSSHES